MDNTTPSTQMPPMQNQPNFSPEKKPQGQGALIGSIIIIILIVVGAFFVLKNSKNVNQEMPSDGEYNQEQVSDTNAYIESQSSVSSSDEMTDIGEDIDSTNVDSVDYGVDGEFK